MPAPSSSRRRPIERPWFALLVVLAAVVVVPGIVAAAHDTAGETAGRGLPGDAPASTAAQEDDESDDRPRLRSEATAPRHPRLAPWLTRRRDPDAAHWNARLLVREATPDALATTLATPGVAHATAAFLGELDVRGADERARIAAAFVDPAGFRLFTPPVTGAVTTLWETLADGGPLLRHETARRLGADAGESLRLGGLLGGRVGGDVMPVEATVSLGRAAVADAVFHADRRDELLEEHTTVLLVGVQRLDELEAVRERLSAAGVGRVELVADPEPYTARIVDEDGEEVTSFEPLTFRSADGGRIDVDAGWRQRNIVRERVPILGEVRCHRDLMPPLRAALETLERDGLAHLIDPGDYGGCWVPRHIDRDPGRGLSLHAWGLAVDVNVQTNLYGAEPELDPRVVEVFERHGFAWGGHWGTPDGMHFELARPPDGA